MSIGYEQLLAATIEHLEQLQARGRQFVCIAPQVLDDLKQPCRQSTIAGSRSAGTGPQAGTPQAFLSSSAKNILPTSAQTGSLSLTSPGVRTDTFAASLIPTSFGPAPFPKDKAEAMAELRKQVLACVQCKHLVAARKHVVFGVGDINARLMFVGEAPGADEDAQGEPFVGAAGQLLTKIIRAMGLTRETVYIGNILKCRPDTPGQKTGNRKPTSAEMKICIPWLEKQIDLIKPEVIVALGATAVEGLLGFCSGISKMRGHWQTYRNIPLMPTFHPSYLLRNASLADKRKVWEDMLQVMTKLRLPINEKQQNYFLKSEQDNK